MKHFRWLFIGVALLLCLGLVAPSGIEAASRHKSSQSSHKAHIKKGSSDSRVSSKRDKRNQTAKISKKSRHKAKNDSQQAKKERKSQPGEREIWLQRAMDSELLIGKASWYGKDFHNKATASGLDYDMYTFTAAHRTLPMGTVVKVTDQENGRSVMVCVTDRGPFVRGRIIDVSYAAARQLGLKDRGVGKVKLEVVSDENGAPLKADQAYFVKYARNNGGNRVGPFRAFADACAMREALGQAHPDAEVVLEKTPRP